MMQLHGDDSESLSQAFREAETIDQRSLKVRIINFAVVVPILIIFNIIPVMILILYSLEPAFLSAD